MQEDVKVAFANLIAPLLEHVTGLNFTQDLIAPDAYVSICTTDAHVYTYITGVVEETHKLSNYLPWKHAAREWRPTATALDKARREELTRTAIRI